MSVYKDLEKIKNDPKALYELTKSLLQNVDKLEKRIQELEDNAALKRFKEYKTNSEKERNLFTHEDYDHFNEAEAHCDDTNPKIINDITGEVKKNKGKNMINETDMSTETIDYTINDNELSCKCGGSFKSIGTKVSYTIKYIPSKIIRQRNVVHSYKCNSCEDSNIITAKRKNPFTKTMVEPSFVAGIIYNKTYNSLPLYRQEREFKSLGIDIRRNNLSNWFIQGTDLLEHLFKLMHKDVLSNDIIHMDETTVPVIQKKNKANSLSYMWLLRSSKHNLPINLYFYKDSREQYNAIDILGDFKGYLHSDGYKAYFNNVGITNVACWAHARRKVYDSVVLAQKNKNHDSLAYELFEMIQKLYGVEQSISKYVRENNILDEELYKYTYNQRQLLSKPIIDDIKTYCETSSLTVLPKSLTGKAIAYINNYIDYLYNYINDGRLVIDNNISERSAKAFAIGRKNFLFSFSERGAYSSAIAYSIVQTAAENNLNIFEYLTYVFENMCDIDSKTEDELRCLLPYSPSLPKHLFIK